ncbi:MAG: hypothetical protein WC635_14670 [Bacteriovorax sp.]|jgi:hypothetical protein
MRKKKTLVIGIVALMLASGCATSARYKMTTNEQIAHGATGVVSVVPTDGNNTKLRLKVKHLYPAENIQNGATNYIVWVRPAGSDRFQNVGALQVDNMLQGEYMTTVPYSSFYVMVTPEKSNIVETPSGPTILEKRIFR